MEARRDRAFGRWRTLDDVAQTRRATFARLQRINATLAAWDDYAADRGDDDVLLSRDALKCLQQTLLSMLGELEALLAETPASRRNHRHTATGRRRGYAADGGYGARSLSASISAAPVFARRGLRAPAPGPRDRLSRQDPARLPATRGLRAFPPLLTTNGARPAVSVLPARSTRRDEAARRVTVSPVIGRSPRRPATGGRRTPITRVGWAGRI
jgi:hypothetical protein